VDSGFNGKIKHMAGLERFGISIPSDLLKRFDQLLEKKGYQNRSEAIRDLLRDFLITEEAQTTSGKGLGTVTLVYDHSVTNLAERLTELQHDHHHNIVSSLHVHLNEELCMEVIVLEGAFKKVKHIADQLISMKGVMHGKLVFSSTNVSSSSSKAAAKPRHSIHD
jgi:CopG family nickel-responsive transcriptional regulator